MDKNYVENRKLECVQLMGYRVFKEIFLEKNIEFVNKIETECLEVIKKERDSEIADTIAVKSIVIMLVNTKNPFVIYVFRLNWDFTSSNQWVGRNIHRSRRNVTQEICIKKFWNEGFWRKQVNIIKENAKN